jgi:hypothetical protein
MTALLTIADKPETTGEASTFRERSLPRYLVTRQVCWAHALMPEPPFF